MLSNGENLEQGIAVAMLTLTDLRMTQHGTRKQQLSLFEKVNHKTSKNNPSCKVDGVLQCYARGNNLCFQILIDTACKNGLSAQLGENDIPEQKMICK